MSTTTSTAAKELPPGPRGLPIFGSLLSLAKDPHLVIHRIVQRNGDVCLLRFGSVPTVVISHPDLLKEAFDKTELADRWVSEIMDILSDQKDLVMAPYGEHWRQLQRFANRELLSPRNLNRIREQHIEEVISSLVEEVGQRSESGQLVEPVEILSRSNSTIMFRAIFGRSEGNTAEFEGHRGELLDLVTWIFKNATATNLADYIPWLKILSNGTLKEAQRQSEISTAIITSLLDHARARPSLDLENPTCLAEVMLAAEAREEITEETIRHLCMDLMLAGIDTTAQTVSWLLLSLANRPEIQEKVHEELDRVIGRGNSPVADDQTRLPYLFAVILENMRLHTVGPFGVPHKASRDCEIGGYLIPEGAQVLGNIYSIHHDPRFWDSPGEFRPERFLPGEDGSHPPALTNGTFIPFGTGHRRCPGRRFGETVVWLHATRLLSQFRFEVPGPGSATLPETEVFGLAVGPKPFSLRAVSRNS